MNTCKQKRNLCVYVDVRTHICIYTYVYMYKYRHICTYVYLFIDVKLHIIPIQSKSQGSLCKELLHLVAAG